MKKSALFLLKLAVTAGALAWLFSKVDVGTVFATLRTVPVTVLILATGLVGAQAFLAAVRWHLLMRYVGLSIEFVRTLQIFWIGQFATVLLPGGVAGDGVRMWVLTRDGTRASTGINSVVLDRAAAMTGLFLLVAVSLPFADDRVAPQLVRYGMAGLLLLAVATGIGIGLSIRLPESWQHWRAARAVTSLSTDLRTICRSPRRAAVLVALSVAGIGCYILTTFVLVRGLGAAVRLSDCMVLAPIVILITTLPVSFGGWGLREGSSVGLFGIIGVAPAISLTASIVIGLISTAVSAPGALVWLRWGREPDADSEATYPTVRSADG